ncbi:programmed cell death protein 2 [Sitophilus oryzae]|uniref:Programmed cell death protein 2 n=1 Tax=Sitophilus oryzae TaxID=7048 RepID=A0A6J2X7W9_SITOR|nr:programmed cell death protein 2 [Sitophilus oryzae]
MPATELGFLQDCEPGKLQSRIFPSKVGGKPSWLSLNPLPTFEDLKCKTCQQALVFLLQIYAPYEDCEVGSAIWEVNFHRTVFVFICRSPDCNKRNLCDNIVVFRSSLSRENDFYSFVPPTIDYDPEFDALYRQLCCLCEACGIPAEKQCSKCRKVLYCSKEHQVIDWKSRHKTSCLKEGPESEKAVSKILFPEFELITATEVIERSDIDEQKELEKFEELKAKGETGTMEDVSESELSSHATSEKDKAFLKFKKQVSHYPDQVIRYSKGGQPLFIANGPIPAAIPNCELCDNPRQFEFQIMPQLLSELKENDLDFGVLLVYTCKYSCVGSHINSYKKEFVFKQDVSLENSV